MALTFNATDLDNAASNDGLVHQDTANTDHNDVNTVKQGYDYANPYLQSDARIIYPLHENSGTVVNDFSGNSNDGTYNGPTLGQTGLLGTSSPSFDAGDDFVDTPITTPSAGFAYSLWVYDATPSGTAYDVLSNRDLNTSNNFAIIQMNNDNTQFYLYDGAQYIAGYGNIIKDSWHHIACVYDGSVARIYINGVEEGSVDASAWGGPGTNTLNIGRRRNDSLYFGGRIADVRIYNRALSDSEIQILYNVVDTAGELITQSKTS